MRPRSFAAARPRGQGSSRSCAELCSGSTSGWQLAEGAWCVLGASPPPPPLGPPPGARTPAPYPAWGRSALMPATHPAQLAGPQACCPLHLGSRHPREQRCQPVKQREGGQQRTAAARAGVPRPGASAEELGPSQVGPRIELGAEPWRRRRLQDAASSAETISSRRLAETLPHCLWRTCPRPAPFAINVASAFICE